MSEWEGWEWNEDRVLPGILDKDTPMASHIPAVEIVSLLHFWLHKPTCYE